MKIETTPRDDHQVTLTVEVESERMEAAKRRAARKISEKGKIPGFRPGKAPYDVVRRYYGEATITQEAVEILVDEVYPVALKEADIKPAAMGQLENIESVEPPVFKFTVPLLPTVDLGAYQKVRKAYEFSDPQDGKFEQSLEDLRRMYAKTETVERAVVDGDFVMVDVKSDLVKEGLDTEELNRDGFPVFVNAEAKENEWPFPGFASQLVGFKPGEANELKHTFAENHEAEALQGETVTFGVTVKTVRGVTLPELNDEFAQQVGGGQTLDELKANLRESLNRQAKSEYDDVYFTELIEDIKSGATIKYPPQVLEHEGEHVLEELKRRLSEQHMDFGTYLKMRQMDAEKFNQEEILPVAQKRLERSLIIDELARAENIKVDEAELEAAFRDNWASLAATDQNFAKATKGGTKASKELIDAVAMDSANRMVVSRVLDRIKGIATGEIATDSTTETPATPEVAAEEQPAKPKSKKAAAAKPAAKKTATADKKPTKKVEKKPAATKPATKKPAAKKSGKK